MSNFEEKQNKRKEKNIIYAYTDGKNYYYAFGRVEPRMRFVLKTYIYWYYSNVTPLAERVLGGRGEYDGRFAILYRTEEEVDFSLFSVQFRWVDSLEELDEYRDIE